MEETKKRRQAYSDAKYLANKKWNDSNLDKVTVMLPKGYKDRLKELGATTGESLNAILRRLVEAELSATQLV